MPLKYVRNSSVLFDISGKQQLGHHGSLQQLEVEAPACGGSTPKILQELKCRLSPLSLACDISSISAVVLMNSIIMCSSFLLNKIVMSFSS